ncbi:MAG TPA: NeuD/PglB/VioB family sugar acetyltransferase [Actinomycetota bacterium]|nr:NeuD/PglB/VioB family sugar acetyltransferase [Actinomycetota bacterium]
MRAGSPELIVVMGGGGHGRETVSLIQDAERAHPGRWELVGVVADGQPDVERLESLGVKWLGPIDGLQPGHACVSVAIGDGHQRARLQRHARGLGYRPATLVHPTAAIGLDVRMGDGCYVGCLTVLTSHVRLGEGVQVNVACSLSHDVTLGDFVTLSPGVRLAGGVVVGDESTIFTGATVLPGVRLGRDVTVGAGAVVVHDVPDGQTVFGVPARPTGGS